jgi:hypothetical protein
MKLLLIVITMLACPLILADELTYQQKLDVQFRFDDRSSSDIRNQYRVRFYPSINYGKAWSLNSFVVTGDDFDSSYNTLFDDSNEYIYVRRAFLRHVSSFGKTELGIIPTYKGRVSATGLSKDGWIGGIRNVTEFGQNSAFEVVVGELNNYNARDAIFTPSIIDYIELEYSAGIGNTHSYEISAERMVDANYVRAEYRYRYNAAFTVFIESILRLDEFHNKVVTGVSGANNSLDYYLYYSYVSSHFGERAELTEDFLGYGHGFSAEIGGELSHFKHTDWFIRFDVVDSVHRFMSGVSVSF